MAGALISRTIYRPTDPVQRRLRALAPLSEEDVAELTRLGERRVRHRAGEELLGEGQTARRARFIVSGWAVRQRLLADGRRQIFGFVLPGEGLGVCPRQSPPALCTVVAATRVDTIDAEPLMQAIREGRAPGVARALEAADRLDDVLAMDHITRLGAQTAYERMCSLLLELQQRLQAAGLGDRQRFPLPLTQEMIADALGLSIVHTNRTLQQLRREKVIELRSGMAVLLQRDLMVNIADFRWPRMASLLAPLSV